jgi:polysaccharide export outer membrane protein
MFSFSEFRVNWPFLMSLLLAVELCLLVPPAYAADLPSQPSQDPRQNISAPETQLGPGDTVSIKVFGQPDMDGTVYVADDGTIHLPLVGATQVAGLSPDQASRKVEKALKDGSFLVNPHVTLTLVNSLNQLVSVLGEVRLPGRYQVTANTTIFQLLAQAGGVNPTSADVIYLIRADAAGNQTRTPINLKGYTDAAATLPTQKFKGGDSVFVPRADQYYIYGEVTQPNQYRLEPGMTVLQAISRAGGITPRGSDRRIEIKRKGPDGREQTFRAQQGDTVQANDVIHVKESIF